MNYAIRFFSSSKKLYDFDEIIIKYDHFTLALDDFIKYHKNQRIIIDLLDLSAREENSDRFNENIELFKQTNEKWTNITLRLNFAEDIARVEQIKDAGLPFYINTPVDNLDTLRYLIDLGVSDVYIANEMGFNLKKVSEFCHNNGVKVRVYPNVAQSGINTYTMDSITKFFIRPDDISAYEEYVDVFEFFGNLVSQDVLYDIYSDGRWQGDLNDLILDLNKEINCMNLFPDFGEHRIKCEKRCMIDKCNYCMIADSFAKELKKKDIYITKAKNQKKEKKYEYKVNEESVLNVSAESLEDIE